MTRAARFRERGALADAVDRCVDVALTAWVAIGRVIVPVLVVVLVGYVTIRPLLDLGGAGTGEALSWSAISAWPALIGNTLLVGVAAAMTALPPALLLGYLLFRSNMPFRRSVTATLLLAACLPLFVTATAVLSLLGFRIWQGSAIIAGIVHGWVALPLAVLIVGQGYRLVDGRLADAASLDASLRRVWFHVDWPLVRWSLWAVGLLVLWVSSTDVTVTDLISVRTFAEEVFITFQLTGSMAGQSLVVVPYFMAFGILLLAAERSARAASWNARALERVTPRVTSFSTMGRVRALGLTLAVLSAAAGPPIVTLVRAVGDSSKFVRLSRDLAPEFATSFLLAGGCAVLVVALVMAVGPAVGRRRRSERGTSATLSRVGISALVLLALPSPLLAASLIELFNRPGPLGNVYDSSMFPLIGHVVRWLPIGLLVAAPGFLRVTPTLTDAARLDGCRGAACLRFLHWPMASRFLLLAGVVTTVLSLGEVTLTVMLSPPGFLPLSVRFFTLAHYGLRGETATICLLTMIGLVLPWTLITTLLQRSDRGG